MSISAFYQIEVIAEAVKAEMGLTYAAFEQPYEDEGCALPFEHRSHRVYGFLGGKLWAWKICAEAYPHTLWESPCSRGFRSR